MHGVREERKKDERHESRRGLVGKNMVEIRSGWERLGCNYSDCIQILSYKFSNQLDIGWRDDTRLRALALREGLS